MKITHEETADVLRELAKALDGAFISTWQSTAAWSTQLKQAIEHLAEYDLERE